jgi:O-antigen/teichoic acid export membrane protein
VVVLMVAMLFGSACGMVDRVLAMAGRTSWNLYNNLAALVVNATVDLILIPRIGIIAAAWGWAAAIVVNNLVPLVQVAFGVRLHPFGRGTVLAMTLSAFCFGVIPGLVRLAGGGPVAVIVAAALAVIPYAVGAVLCRQSLHLGDLAGALRRRRPAVTT